jgi:hypothetical protein
MAANTSVFGRVTLAYQNPDILVMVRAAFRGLVNEPLLISVRIAALRYHR